MRTSAVVFTVVRKVRPCCDTSHAASKLIKEVARAERLRSRLTANPPNIHTPLTTFGAKTPVVVNRQRVSVSVLSVKPTSVRTRQRTKRFSSGAAGLIGAALVVASAPLPP